MTIAQHIEENKFLPLDEIAYGICMILANKAFKPFGLEREDADGKTITLANGNVKAESIVMADGYSVFVEVEMKGKKIVNKFISKVNKYID